MGDTRADIYYAKGKRRILIVDDELINREILKFILEEDYEPLTAEDGESALEIIRAYGEDLSLILLDLLMPGMHGLEVLQIMQDDPVMKKIPVIVLTADRQAEVESLRHGAVDFLVKPYPEREIILARVRRTIELSEDRQTIQSTERDPLTGLLNREFFFRYARQFDRLHTETETDAVVVDVNHFHIINERYGRTYSDGILRRIGEKLRETVSDAGGIVCRREADTFLVYCPHRENYTSILDNASVGLSGDTDNGNRVRLRMGVYAVADKTMEMERRFDRAKMAADTVRNNYLSNLAFFDKALHEKEIHTERLLEDFRSAIQNKQFRVFFQPKFNITAEVPVLASAEALVRWIHPELGFISPGDFIPIFEENGLIQQLDQYVWRETASRLCDWQQRLGISVPVSVNVSRVDMYDPDLVDTFQNLLTEHGITADDMLLEITESAYTEDAKQIINKVNRLRELGFKIEMDDFGTGYSSLNMISTLPIDALKLDMSFIRNAFQNGGDTRLIEMIIDIADYLQVPVIAEGVETEQQLNALKKMGCDLVQGYYFSKPVPPEEFERFIEEKKRRLSDAAAAEKEGIEHNTVSEDALHTSDTASSAKNDFLSKMSHELRTPMNTIIGLGNLALQKENLDADTRTYLEKIDADANRLLHLLNDILDMSSIESGRMILRQEKFSLKEMLDRISAAVMVQCSKKGLKYICNVGSGVSEHYIGDSGKLRQSLMHILSNAVKFTDAPGSVTLTVEQKTGFANQSAIHFTVKDTGVGINKDFIPKIFEPFTQEYNSLTDKYGGTGLGMAITKHLVELMNGTIEVKSEKGTGSTFTAVVTLKDCTPPEENGADNPDGSDTICAKLEGKHILLAEDMLINAEIIRQLLSARQAETDHAENGKAAVALFNNSAIGHYDAILMDIRMPEMDGLEAAAAIRTSKRPDAESIPIIALSANAFDEDVQRSLQVGMNAHLAKPVEPDRLFRTLEDLIGKAEQGRREMTDQK